MFVFEAIALQMLGDEQLTPVEVRIAVADDNEGGALESVWPLLGNNTQNNGTLSLVDFVRDPTMWNSQAPWMRGGGVIDSVVQTLATSSILPASETPGEGAAELPRVVKILLDLIQRGDLDLKSAASAFLIRIFRTRTAVRRTIQHVDLICDKSIAIKNRTLQDLICDFRLNSRHILSQKLEFAEAHSEQASYGAFERCSTIFERITLLLEQSKSPEESLLTQRLIAGIGFHREAVSLLVQSHENSKLGSSAAVAGASSGAEVLTPQTASLYNVVYRFLALVCANNTTLQQEVVHMLACDAIVAPRDHGSEATGHEVDLIKTHLQMEGMNPEPLMQVVLSQNLKLNSLLGREWGRFIVTKLNSAYFSCPKGAQLIKVLCSVVRCKGRPIKEFQDHVRTLIQSNQQLLSLLEPDDMRYVDADWDFSRLCPSDRWLLETKVALLTLLSDLCKGKNPASVLFAERLLPFQQVVKTSIRVAMRPFDESDGDALPLAACLQGALLTVLRRVYLTSNHQEMCPELATSGNGLWSWETEQYMQGGQKALTLMPALALQLRTFVDSFAGWPRDKVKAFTACLREAIVPFLLAYYIVPGFRLPERALACNVETGDQIWDALFKLYKKLNKKDGTFEHMNRDEQAELRAKSVALMNCLVHNGGVERQVISDQDEEDEAHAVDPSARVSECLRAGFERFCGDIEAALRESDRSYMLPLMLSVDEEVSIYDDAVKFEGDAIPNPRMPMLVIDCLSVLRPSADDQLLLEWLSLLRGIMYISDPIACKASDISASIARSLSLIDDGQQNQLIEARWGTFTHLSSILRAHEGDRTMLSWVQEKFNAIGCTDVALRLCSHENVVVQMQARLLLIALMEGSNEAVQARIAAFLKTHKRSHFFRVAHEALVDTQNSLKDLKRCLKLSTRLDRRFHWRARESVQDDSKFADKKVNLSVFDDSVASQSELVRIDRNSHVMVLLRQLQLMCSGQHIVLQDLMQKQSSTGSCNLLRACTTLIGAVQPLTSNVVSDKDPTPFLVLQTQLLATVCSMSQGPNILNQREILQSSVLFDVNRIFSSVSYIVNDTSRRSSNPSDDVSTHAPSESQTSSDVKHLNSLIGLLRIEAIKLCLSFFDSVLAPDVPTSMIGFFDISNLFAQLLVNAEILGLSPEYSNSKKAQSKSEKAHWDSLFTRGYRAHLRTEMLLYYHLLRYFKYYEDGDEVSRHLKVLKQKHPTLLAYLKKHSYSVEVARYISVDASGVPSVVDREDSCKKQVDKVFFPVSEHMVELVESKGFKVKWHDLIWELPHTKPDDKQKEFVAKMRCILAMATWLQTVANSAFGHFLIRKQELLRIVQLRVSIVITLLLILAYGLPVDPNDGKLVANGTWHPGPYRSRPPAGYSITSPYPYVNFTSGMLWSVYWSCQSFLLYPFATLFVCIGAIPTR